tara:strand:- start:280 stop:414 length:135 start_codon:yes stop_codon:yes gene_type:complete
MRKSRNLQRVAQELCRKPKTGKKAGKKKGAVFTAPHLFGTDQIA